MHEHEAWPEAGGRTHPRDGTGLPGPLLLSVADQGPGLPPEFLPHIFGRFTRAETSRAIPGSGRGLALVTHSHDGIAHPESPRQGRHHAGHRLLRRPAPHASRCHAAPERR
ncbi:ATP-binding protein [Streptomyces sp. NPDC048504]|uniref:ATP-binding protein n=1 Tax=Streptomyces sp. NPDC048504 TaxID=3365559 RepID=UPI00371F50E8